jgi:hypothetical protein
VIDETLGWLSNEEKFTKLLRNIPRRKRSRFLNKCPKQDVNQMIQAKIIEKVQAREGPSLAFIKLKSVNERRKKRRRLILETRDINKAIKMATRNKLTKIKLPMQRDIESAMRKHKKVDSVDFRSFFYHIEIDPAIRKFFRVLINGDEYQLRVLPMGACFSVFVAQNIAIAAANILRTKYGYSENDSTTVVYR